MGDHTLNRLGLQIKTHWRRYRPKMYRALEEAGELDRAVYEAQERNGNALADLVEKGQDWNRAWESVREEWAFLPSEEEDDERWPPDPEPVEPPRGKGWTLGSSGPFGDWADEVTRRNLEEVHRERQSASQGGRTKGERWMSFAAVTVGGLLVVGVSIYAFLLAPSPPPTTTELTRLADLLRCDEQPGEKPWERLERCAEDRMASAKDADDPYETWKRWEPILSEARARARLETKHQLLPE